MEEVVGRLKVEGCGLEGFVYVCSRLKVVGEE